MPLNDFKDRFPAIVAALTNARRGGRMSHAYLVYSDNPALSREFSSALAQACACPCPIGGDACGACAVCRQIAKGNYPDMMSLSPVSKGRNIRIGKDSDEPDTYRSFEYFFYLRGSSDGGRKIGLIYEAECMTEEAQNAFLKTLEEPPGNSVFILCTPKPFQLLPTIRSRCQFIVPMTNSVEYGFPGSQEILGALERLHAIRAGDLLAAEQCASAIIAAVKELEAKAEEIVGAKWSDRKLKEYIQDLDKTRRRRLEERREAEEKAEYLKFREQFASMIHVFFSQIYLLACGAAVEDIPNPELVRNIAPPAAPDSGAEGRALRQLKAADSLLESLSWSVVDALAIRSFCIEAARAAGK